MKEGRAILDHLEPCDVEGYCLSEAALAPGQWHHLYVAALSQYPLVVSHYTELASQLPKQHTASEMMDVCHATVVFASEHMGDHRMMQSMELLDSTAGYCKGLARVMERLGVLQRVGGDRDEVKREGYFVKTADGERRWVWRPIRTVCLGKADPPAKYRLLHDCSRLESLLAVSRAALTDFGSADDLNASDLGVLQEPIRTKTDLVEHMAAFIRMLSRWPAELHVCPPRTKTAKALPGSSRLVVA